MSTRGALKTPGSSRNNLLVELWRNILEEACQIPGKDEFATDPRGYCDFPYDQPVPSSKITSEELQDALNTRLAVALVCKSWHSVGLPILHSHIRPRFTDSTNFLAKEYSWIFENVQLRDRVRRVSITLDKPYRKGRLASSIDPKLIFVLCHLSHPVILSAPWAVFWELPPYKRSSLVIADLTGAHDTSLGGLYTEGWENLKYLSIRLDDPMRHGNTPSEPMLLPALTCLKIYVVRQGFQNPCDKWHAPMLHTMLLDDDIDWAQWKRFLEKHSSTLQILNIHSYPEDALDFPAISLENLRELWMQPGPRSYFPSSLIHAPRLQRIVTHRWQEYRYQMDHYYYDVTLKAQCSLLKRMLQRWLVAPMIPTYCISAMRLIVDEVSRSAELDMLMKALRERGSEVTIVCKSGEPLL